MTDTVEYEPAILDQYGPYKGVRSWALQIDNRVSIQVLTDLINRYHAGLSRHEDGPVVILDLTYNQLEQLCADYEQFVVYFDELAR